RNQTRLSPGGSLNRNAKKAAPLCSVGHHVCQRHVDLVSTKLGSVDCQEYAVAPLENKISGVQDTWHHLLDGFCEPVRDGSSNACAIMRTLSTLWKRTSKHSVTPNCVPKQTRSKPR